MSAEPAPKCVPTNRRLLTDRSRSSQVQLRSGPTAKMVNPMLYTIAVVLVILWLLGLVTSYTLGGFVHLLLVIALVMILINFISGRRVL